MREPWNSPGTCGTRYAIPIVTVDPGAVNQHERRTVPSSPLLPEADSVDHGLGHVASSLPWGTHPRPETTERRQPVLRLVRAGAPRPRHTPSAPQPHRGHVTAGHDRC